jgi:DNA-binding response OmpR family regulator
MTTPALLLTVGANTRNLELLAQFLGKEGYQTIAAATLDEFDQALNGAQAINLALVDIGGFDRGIWDVCERLRTKDIPLLVISAKQSASIDQQSMTHGARGVLVKPLVIRELLALVRNLIEVP